MRHSPCIGICKLDDATGYCLGCGRTGREIGDWIAMSEGQRDAVWSELPVRLSKLSVRVQLLPWTCEELVTWAAGTIVGRAGTWVTGAPGAVAEFPCTAERPISVEAGSGSMIARAPDASFRLRLNDKVRAFYFSEGGAIVLGLPRARAVVPSSQAIQTLGPDLDAIDAEHQGELLFDFGIGRKNSRFCIRTGDELLASELTCQRGRHWSDAMASIGKQILAASPARVVETAAARIEVFTKIPSPAETSPPGAHTHFLPDFLKGGEEIPSRLTLPDYASPVAIFYPHDSGKKA
ncbi:DUF1289 domain-containing protein [Hyphomicrobium sp.]|uniref:DUF1289 domain-containing protein n=1 Tax=Hyphomicrobium sp. TaxID=82 RepID=UPI002D77B2E5|nr:DUF1289 domain-containing protein [Hyphomicrobium sp.]HET6390445.1 DUF1289 domain-containing protein [Hyphomicrobium sp.]